MKNITEFGITTNYFNSEDMMIINSESSIVKIITTAQNYLNSGTYSKKINSARYQSYLIKYEKALDKAVAKMGIDPNTARYSNSFGDLMS
jgi:hypothetical protein